MPAWPRARARRRVCAAGGRGPGGLVGAVAHQPPMTVGLIVWLCATGAEGEVRCQLDLLTVWRSAARGSGRRRARYRRESKRLNRAFVPWRPFQGCTSFRVPRKPPAISGHQNPSSHCGLRGQFGSAVRDHSLSRPQKNRFAPHWSTARSMSSWRRSMPLLGERCGT